MPTSHIHSQAVKQQVHLRIQPSPYTSPQVLITPETPTFSDHSQLQLPHENTWKSYYTVMISVLCMYDFTDDGETLLRFRRSEMLDVLKCDVSGWWAAMRRGGPIVGWIPQSFVVPLSDEMADRLRNLREELRIPEYEAEQLYLSAPVLPPITIYDESNTVRSASKENTIPTLPTRSTPLLHRSRSVIQANGSSSRTHPAPSTTSHIPNPPILSLKRATSHARIHDIERTNTPIFSSRSLRKQLPVLEKDLALQSQQLNSMRPTEKPPNPETSSLFDALKLRRKDTQENKSRPSMAPAGRWFLQTSYPGEVEADLNGFIRNGTFRGLVERLTTDVVANAPIKLSEQRSFMLTFLTTYWTFTTAQCLLEALLDRFNITPPVGLTDAEYKDWKAYIQIPTQRRVLEIITTWVEEYHLLDEPGFSRQLTDFLTHIISSPHAAQASQLIKIITQLSTTPAKTITTASPKKFRKTKPPKSDLTRSDPVDIAEQLTLVEFALYAKVTPQECIRYIKQTGNREAAPNLVDFCATYDKLGNWIKSTILGNDALGKRADMVDFWIRVAEKCRALNNFFSMSGIINALSSSDMTRLHLTWAHVSRKAQLESLLRHNEPTGGFAGYRALLQHASGPCVPFITMYLVDNHHAEDKHKDVDGRISFLKRARIYEITNNILRFQSKAYNITPKESVMTFIENQFRDGALPVDSWYLTRSQEVQKSELAHADIRRGLEAAGF